LFLVSLAGHELVLVADAPKLEIADTTLELDVVDLFDE
jgi:hypothetical protein